DLVFLLDAVDRVLELIVAELVTELPAPLDNQHLVNDANDQLGSDFVKRLAKLSLALVALQVKLLAPLTERGDLARLEIGLREDLPIHLDQYLLDDVGASNRRRHGAEQQETDGRCGRNTSFRETARWRRAHG